MGTLCSAKTEGNAISSKENTLEKQKILEVYGDHFDADTRSILTIMEISNKPYNFKEVNTFLGQHRQLDYLSLNPTGQIPLITDKNYKIFGRSDIYLQYLTNTIFNIKELMPQEHTKELSIGLNWFIRVFKPASTRLLKIILAQKYFGAAEPESQEADDAKSEFFDKVLPQMENMLTEKEFLCTN